VTTCASSLRFMMEWCVRLIRCSYIRRRTSLCKPKKGNGVGSMIFFVDTALSLRIVRRNPGVSLSVGRNLGRSGSWQVLTNHKLLGA